MFKTLKVHFSNENNFTEKHMKGRKILRINDIVEVDSEEISIPRGPFF